MLSPKETNQKAELFFPKGELADSSSELRFITELGRSLLFVVQDADMLIEVLIYKVNRNQLDKIAKAKSAKIQLGEYTWTVNDISKKYMVNLLEASK